MGRYLGIDYGLVRVGLALSDPLAIIAQPWQTIKNEGLDSLASRICSIIEENDISDLVFGKPLHLSGDEGILCVQITTLSNKIAERKPRVGLHFQDERFTSVEATRAIHATGGKPSYEKGRVDAVAASLILSTFLDSISKGEALET
ncbi:Holliday junction resolvase RuvX [bacterium]|nr:Holliday junction resolvase RuvX [bacterium]